MHLKVHPLSNCKIDLPVIPGISSDNLNSGVADPDLYEHVKYIFVTKTFNSVRPYKLFGIRQVTRCYGIGILTDTNRYYYSELHTRHNTLTKTMIRLFKKTIVTHYKIDKNTKIAVTENITNEPLLDFLHIVAGLMKTRVRHVKEMSMYRALNRAFHYVRVKCKTSKNQITKNHRKKMIRKLFEHKRFDFVQYPNWEKEMETMRKRSREATLGAALGILYLHTRDILTDYNRKYLTEEYQEEKKKRDMEKVEK